jgi:hypothetical protein
VNEDKIITGEEFGPTGLLSVEDFGGHNDFEVLGIGFNLDRVFGAF